jgi:hypothetical protein
MGLKGSATCQLRFEKAKDWLVGEPHTGLSAMFLMMNAARLHVGVKSVGHLEGARQKAYAYAFDRKQSKAPSKPEGVEADVVEAGGADLIAHHPAVRHKLWRLSAFTQAARVLSLWAVSLLDEQECSSDEQRKQDCSRLVALLTPIVKGFLTDTSYFGCDDALSVFGGYGYIHEYGIEQHVRDVRVTRLYEGSNEIQAIDLVMRKMLGKRSGLPLLIDELSRTATLCEEAMVDEDKEFTSLLSIASKTLTQQLSQIDAVMPVLAESVAQDQEAPFRVADDALQAMGYVMCTWAWAKIVLATKNLQDSEFRDNQRQLSRYGLEWLSSLATVKWDSVAKTQRALPWAKELS